MTDDTTTPRDRRTRIIADALIFDMDGLMVDSEWLWWSAERALAAEHGKTWTDAMAQRCMGQGLPLAVRTMRKELGLAIGNDEGVAWLVDYFVARCTEVKTKPGCLKLIKLARQADLPIAVASSSSERVVSAVLTHIGLLQAFDAVICGDAVVHSKPAPDIFLLAEKTLNKKDARYVVLEDSMAGVKAGRAAAMTVIAVPERDRTAFLALTPYVAHDLHEAAAMLGLESS